MRNVVIRVVMHLHVHQTVALEYRILLTLFGWVMSVEISNLFCWRERKLTPRDRPIEHEWQTYLWRLAEMVNMGIKTLRKYHCDMGESFAIWTKWRHTSGDVSEISDNSIVCSKLHQGSICIIYIYTYIPLCESILMHYIYNIYTHVLCTELDSHTGLWWFGVYNHNGIE